MLSTALDGSALCTMGDSPQLSLFAALQQTSMFCALIGGDGELCNQNQSFLRRFTSASCVSDLNISFRLAGPISYEWGSVNWQVVDLGSNRALIGELSYGLTLVNAATQTDAHLFPPLPVLAEVDLDGYWLADATGWTAATGDMPDIVFRNQACEAPWGDPSRGISPNQLTHVITQFEEYLRAPVTDSLCTFQVLGPDGSSYTMNEMWHKIMHDGRTFVSGLTPERSLDYQCQCFADIADSMNEVFFLVQNDEVDAVTPRVLFVTAAFERLWEAPAEALYADRGLWLRKVVESERQYVIDSVSAAMAGRSSYDITYHLKQNDGSLKAAHVIGTLIKDSDGQVLRMAGVVYDVTEAEEAQRALTDTQMLLNQIVEHVDDAVWLCQLNPFKFIFVNNGFLRMSGDTRENLYSVTGLPNNIPKTEQAMVWSHIVGMAAGLPCRFRHRSIIDGETRYIEVSGMPIVDEGCTNRACGVSRDVTNEERVQQELREANERFGLVANSMESVFWIKFYDTSKEFDEAISVEYVSQAYDGIWQQAREQLTVDANEMFHPIHPEDVQLVKHDFSEFHADPAAEVLVLKYRVLRKDGTIRDIVDKARKVGRTGTLIKTVWMSQDVTDMRTMERSLSESNLRFSSIADTVSDVLWMAEVSDPDPNGLVNPAEAIRIVYINKAWHTLLHQKIGQNQTSDLIASVSSPDRPALTSALAAWCQGKGERVLDESFRVTRDDDSTIYVSLTGRRVRAARDGEGWLATGLIRDVTEQHLAAAERRDLEEQMRQAQKLESLGIMAGGISHDFNNLLQIIVANIEVLDFDDPRPVSEGHMAEILSAARCATDLTHQMLAYCGRAAFNLAMVDLNTLISGVTGLLEATVSKKADLVLNLNQGIPPIRADVAQARQVVMNLISNASEAIGDQDGRIVVSTGWAWCPKSFLLGSDAIEGEYVTLEVSDTGCGMDDAVRERIFEPFYTTKFTGRGLGMSAVLGSVRRHKGAIHVESTAGAGTTFMVLFPLTDDDHPPVEPDERGEIGAPEHWKGSGVVLLVDDEVSIRKVTRRMLHRLGFDAIEAADGAEAVAVFRERSHEISVVLLDMMMPVMDGAEAFPVLRGIDASVPVVMVSGYDESDVTGQLAVGLAGFIQKPYTKAALRDTMYRLTDARGGYG